MLTSAKKQFKRFADLYRHGKLQKDYIERLRQKFEVTRQEIGVMDSWFAYCELEYGKIEQPQLVDREQEKDV